MTNAKSAVRAALLELIEADKVATKAPWRNDAGYLIADVPNCHPGGENIAMFVAFPRVERAPYEANCEVTCLARNLAPGMARGILKMLDEPDCNTCRGVGLDVDAVPRFRDGTLHLPPCPDCAARWQEWAGWLGVA